MKTTRYNLPLMAIAILLLGATAIAQSPRHVMANLADTK